MIGCGDYKKCLQSICNLQPTYLLAFFEIKHRTFTCKNCMQKEESLFKGQRYGAKLYELFNTINEKHKIDMAALEYKIELMHKQMEKLQHNNVKKS